MEATALIEGTRVVLARNVERFPHFIAKAGLTGTITEATDELVCAKMDAHLPGAEEWDNEVCWQAEDEYPGPQQSALNAADRDLGLLP